MELPHTPQALAAALPDVPRWIETRALVLSGSALLRVSHDGAGGVVLDTTFPAGGVIGRADPILLQEVLADASPDFELVVQMDAVQQAQAALPGWTTRRVIVHLRARPCEATNLPTPASSFQCRRRDVGSRASPRTCGPTRRSLKRLPSAS